MAHFGRPWPSLIRTALLLAIVLLPEFLGAVPVGQDKQEEAVAVSDDVRADAMANLKKLVRNRRNVPVVAVPQFKRVPDFWGWYKYFMDTHNQERVEDLDRLYLAYLQNKHRSEEGPTFNHYLKHLSEIYKTCADSEDPECIAEFTSKPKAAVVMPAPIKSAGVRMCNPYLDPYCLYSTSSKAAVPEPELAPVKAPAPIFTPVLPMHQKGPAGYYYAPVLEPFLNAEQRSELLRICHHEDVECLQYHLRAAFGYRPALGPAPSYSALKCDPKDPYCMPTLVQKAPTGFYHVMQPSCDPSVDPLCVGKVAGPAPLAAVDAPREQHCNPLFDAGCNPLAATRLASLSKPVLEYTIKNQHAPPAAPLTCDPRTNPYCILAAAAALRHKVRYQLGAPVKSGSEAPDAPSCHPYDPSCSQFAPPASIEAPKTGKDGIILPDPDCDPEYDFNCRLRHAEPAASADEPIADEENAADEPAKEAAVQQSAVPSFEDFLRGVLSQQ
ncbi:actinodin2 [Fundulus heteroclitus]|uniref:actinodin2 n=1 Tax=Fundulus heteroclitus TaxID=8078 RepID=UPI00165C992A|nr:actinodin2 [Fundulus heteroclitus]